jgi:hypothetical protein
MKLTADWKHVLKKAWSVRLMILAGLLSGAEVILPLFIDTLPRRLFAVLSMVVITAAFVARLTAQRGFDD